MKTNLTKIGNSKGVIIPARFLKECRLDDIVSIDIKNDTIVISKSTHPRSGWSKAFAEVSKREQEPLIDDALPNRFDDEEWTW